MNAPTFTGPIDYTEIVYCMHWYSVAPQIVDAADRGEDVDAEVLAWAKQCRFLPHVDVTIAPEAADDPF